MKIFRFCLLVFLVQIAVAQQPTTGVLQGVVVQEGTNTPLGNARVDLRATAGGATLDSSTTDRDGRFSFIKVPPGVYRLIVSRLGYVNAEYGQRLPNGPTQTLTVTPGQRLNNIRMTMTPGGVISGRATDNGQPVGIADVYAMKMYDSNGTPGLVAVMSAKTNDLGEYRIFWLPPGQYYIALDIQDQASQGPLVVNPDGDDVSYLFRQRSIFRAVLNRAVGAGAATDEKHVMTFYPGTVDAERAVPVQVRAGTEAPNVNISGASLPIRTVRGKVNGLPTDFGLQTPGVELGQTSISGGIAGQRLLDLELEKDGSFEIQRVIPGFYQVIAAAGNLLGGTTIEVAGTDVNNVQVNLVPGLEVTGRVVIERQAPVSPDPVTTSLNVILRPEVIRGATLGSQVAADGSFKIPQAATSPGVPTGDYRVFVAPIHIGRTIPGQAIPLPPQLQSVYVKSIRLGDRDLLNETLHIERQLQDQLEIIIGTNPGSIEGRVMTNRQQPAGAVWVALMPTNKLRFKVDHKFVSTDADGRFKFENVPPGDYEVYGWEDIEKLSWQESKIMRAFESRGTALHVDEGRKTTIELTAIPSQN